MAGVHADRRDPQIPETPLDLTAAIDELLATAAEQRAGRAARTLTPGSEPRQLKQTLLALAGGQELDEHVAPGQATLQVLRGTMTLRWEDQEQRLDAGSWSTIPAEPHRLVAESDGAALITTVTDT
jgi:quercetin dioxygenase-like cupin family protein